MKTRRAFLGSLASVGMAHAMLRRDAIARAVCAGRDAQGESAVDLAGNEDYWSQIQRCFDTDRTLVNFNNGGVCPAPSHVLEQMIRDLRFCNESPAHHMWEVLEPRIETVRCALAKAFGCDPDELAITRNASEGMETLILGIELNRGDEVIVTDHNYPRMLTTWNQRARREGIVVKTISFPVPLPSPDRFVDQVRRAITPKTRAIEFPHITNLTGQILPVRDVVRLGRQHGIAVFIDGAHSFAHFPFTRDQLDCDFFATSLHKWLLAPVGTGFLYIRKRKQKSI
jgi:selenocysteine lyase/cysteine desulfurase